MNAIIIVGGGLSGLAAAWELEQIGITPTLIEVKPRLGGSIISERRGGFLLDGAHMLIEKYGAWDFLEPLGLADALRYIGRYRDGRLVVFRDGTQVLIDALTARLRANVLTRMAVSGIVKGNGGGYEVCLENGILLTARAVIVAAPARHAAHILASLIPEAAVELLDYRYDPVARVMLGLNAAEVTPEIERRVEGAPVRFVEWFALPERVPPGHVLLRAGVRLDVDPAISTPESALALLKSRVGIAPVVEWAHYWAEADPLTLYLPEHAALMARIDAALPEGVAIVGSDYRARRFDARVEDARGAARRIAHYLAT
jgi:protoporphyrinogen oxidase